MSNLLYEGKAKKVYANKSDVVIYFKDDATAFNGKKKQSIMNKGIINCEISTIIFNELASNNIDTHFIKQIDSRSLLCKKVEIIMLEVVVRNYASGSICKRLEVENGVEFEYPIVELYLKDDMLNDPLVNDYHIQTLNLCTKEQLNLIYETTQQINKILINLFLKCNIKIVDFKIEFGIDSNGKVILADEISPDCCRLWDTTTNKIFDKDIFRNDLGDLMDGYNEVLNRLKQL